MADKVAVRLRNEHPLYDAMSLRRQFDDQIRLRSCGLPVPRCAGSAATTRCSARSSTPWRSSTASSRAICPRTTAAGGWPICQRRSGPPLWWDAVDHVVALHTIDPDAAGFSFDSPREADALMASMLAARHQMLDRFAGPDDLTTIRTALSWLEARAPHLDGPLRLCWGDARLPNMAFVDAHVSAVLDWEDLHLAWPVFDLAWFIYMDAISAIQGGLERLAGLPDAEATVARWCDGTGLDADGLAWATVYSAVELATGFAAAFSSFVGPDQLAETLASLESGPIFTDLQQRLH
ncbi:MAG: phosphotransferase [Acidimicrobiales bacterium]